MPRNFLLVMTLVLASASCGPAGEEDGAAGDGPLADSVAAAEAADSEPAAVPDDRPPERLDTLRIEGMPEPMPLRLYGTPDDFRPGFGAYVPGDMLVEETEADDEGDGRSVHFRAAFGGQVTPDAFIHLYVFPDTVTPAGARAAVRGYEAGRGIPVSRGIEPLPEPEAGRRMPWALEAYTFRYQSGGQWYLGSIGLGSHAGRLFHLITHYPAEYGDGFGPRADILLRTWRWADGSMLVR